MLPSSTVEMLNDNFIFFEQHRTDIGMHFIGTIFIAWFPFQTMKYMADDIECRRINTITGRFDRGN